MAKAEIATAPLFVAAEEARGASEEVLLALMRVRAARRFTCKTESKVGRSADEGLYEAEAALERALRTLGATRGR